MAPEIGNFLIANQTAGISHLLHTDPRSPAMPMGRTLRPRLPRLSAYGQSLARSAATYTGDRLVKAKGVEEERPMIESPAAWPMIESPAAWMKLHDELHDFYVHGKHQFGEIFFLGNHKRLQFFYCEN